MLRFGCTCPCDPICHDMEVQRKTGAKYLENYYINERLFELFLNYSESVNTEDVEIIRTE